MVNTIDEHISVISAHDYVWWGKFGMGMSQEMFRILKDQMGRDFHTKAYLAKYGKIQYVANIIDISGATGYGGEIRSPERKATPAYYNRKTCGVWFKMNSIEPISIDVVRSLMMFKDVSRRPLLTGMQTMMYVTEMA